MIATAVACLPIFLTDHSIARWEGGLFFLAYKTYLVMDATPSAEVPVPGSDSLTIIAIVYAGLLMNGRATVDAIFAAIDAAQHYLWWSSTSCVTTGSDAPEIRLAQSALRSFQKR